MVDDGTKSFRRAVIVVAVGCLALLLYQTAEIRHLAILSVELTKQVQHAAHESALAHLSADEASSRASDAESAATAAGDKADDAASNASDAESEASRAKDSADDAGIKADDIRDKLNAP